VDNVGHTQVRAWQDTAVMNGRQIQKQLSVAACCAIWTKLLLEVQQAIHALSHTFICRSNMGASCSKLVQEPPVPTFLAHSRIPRLTELL
jgi:hypothetical protein